MFPPKPNGQTDIRTDISIYRVTSLLKTEYWDILTFFGLENGDTSLIKLKLILLRIITSKVMGIRQLFYDKMYVKIDMS